jgi:hypothetical protein
VAAVVAAALAFNSAPQAVTAEAVAVVALALAAQAHLVGVADQFLVELVALVAH